MSPTRPDGPSKAQLDALRTRMDSRGLQPQQIKDEMMRRYGFRTRQAWRHAYGWSLVQMAQKYNALHDRTGRAPMRDVRLSHYERWPNASERPTVPTLQAIAAVFGTPLAQVVDDEDLTHMPEQDRQLLAHLLQRGEVNGRQSGSAAATSRLPDVAYLEIAGEPVVGESGTSREVAMAAHEGSKRAARAERRDIGDATLEQIRAELTEAAREYVTGEPFPIFRRMQRIRSRVYTVLDRHLWPRDEVELYFTIAALNGLMANAANDLGFPQYADELIRAGWAHAFAINHRPLLGFLRGQQANIAYWHNRPREAFQLAQAGLGYLPAGSGAIRLHCIRGMAAAKLGSVDEARTSITNARRAREVEHHDELHDEIAGQFACPPAKQHYLEGTAYADVQALETEAIETLETAVHLFEMGPAAERSYGCEAIARVHLAGAQLRMGALDAVDLQPVFDLPPDRRIDVLPERLTGLRPSLADRRYQGAPQAAELDERIEAFCRETIVSDLHELPANSG